MKARAVRICRAMASAMGFVAGLLIGSGMLANPAMAYEVCGDLRNSFGPFDYRTALRDQKRIVEGAHFTPEVESLTRGNTSTRPGGDISYTLRAFPNHPRALFAMVRLGEKEKTQKPVGSRYTVSCWFDRALRFAPDDGAVRVIFGIYLLRNDKQQAAIEQLEIARKFAGSDANIQYNLGLAYFDLKQYDRSLEHAHAAYSLGFPLPGLRQKLQKAGKWQDPPPAVEKPSDAAKAETQPVASGRPEESTGATAPAEPAKQ